MWRVGLCVCVYAEVCMHLHSQWEREREVIEAVCDAFTLSLKTQESSKKETANKCVPAWEAP